MASIRINLCKAPSALLVLAVFVVRSQCSSLESCAPGVNTPGVTIPKGDIMIEYGNPLEIFCILCPEYVAKGRNASQLVFYKHDTAIAPEFMQVINETTLRLYEEKPLPSSTMYYCRLKADPEHNPKEETVCLNTVFVGFKPAKVENFTCVSHNWVNLNCTWDVQPNFVHTEYKLFYYLSNRTPSRKSSYFECPTKSDILENYCYWDQKTVVSYRQPYENYTFLFQIKNHFQNTSQRIKFRHYANVIPTKATNLTILEKTTHSAQIEWALVFPMQNFPPGVIQKVEFQSQYDARDHWQIVNTSHLSTKASKHRLNITEFKYANTFYDIRVFMRSALNLEDRILWSQPATITVKTKDTIPGAAPKTDIGSFEVTAGFNSREVYLYWQQIPEYMKNGEDFAYKVIYVKENGVPRNITPNEITHTYAVFKGLSLKSYHFGIASSNRQGLSIKSTEIFVPAQSESLPEPISFTKIAFKNNIYELSWKPPPNNQKIESYSIFWCNNTMDRPYQCTGYLDWIKVDKNVTIKNITVPQDKIYQFAISANSKTESSGMVWASCTVIHDRGVRKMKSFWINRIGARYIELGWKLECSDRIGVVIGFRIFYCPIVSPNDMECKGDVLMNTTILGDSSTIHGNITGLIPYTTYKVAIIVLTKSGGQGQPSDYQFNTTLEAQPDTPPQHVHLSNVTNTSMVVSWDPPPSMNGVLRYYEIHYNDKVLKSEGSSSPEALITNLSSYTNYSVSVTACTTSCSIKSPPVFAHTAIGIPGIMERPSVQFQNLSIFVYWKPPTYTAGYVDYYQVLVEKSDDKQNASVYVYNSTETQKQIDEENCKSAPQSRTYRVSLRAVNIDSNNVSLAGPWSQFGEGACFVTGPSNVLWAIMYGILFLIVAFILTFTVKRVWHKCEGMYTVEVTLPAGLAPSIENKKDQEYHIQMHFPKQQRTEVDHKSENSADQELLLQKKGNQLREGYNDHASVGEGDGDSSGCSSGHDSVSSSLTSGTHISSDSGTEADQRAPSPDGVFNDSELPSSSLRQRIINPSSSGSDAGGNRRDRGEPYVMLGISNSSLAQSAPNLNERENPDFPFLGYCRVGGSPTKPGPVSGYVSFSPSSPFLPPAPPVASNSNGYVSHPPCWEEIKDSPAIPPAAPVASKGYIMAGNINPPLSYCQLGLKKPNGHTYNDYVPHRQLDFNL